MIEADGQGSDGGRKAREVADNRDSVRVASDALLADAQSRQEFLEDPVTYLRSTGAVVNEDIKLTDRDRDVVRLMADERVAEIYEAGKVGELETYLRESYPNLLGDPSRLAWAEMDFHVLIEAVAVAIGVAFVPVLPVDRVSEVARLESVLNARLAAQEARISALEGRIG